MKVDKYLTTRQANWSYEWYCVAVNLFSTSQLKWSHVLGWSPTVTKLFLAKAFTFYGPVVEQESLYIKTNQLFTVFTS